MPEKCNVVKHQALKTGRSSAVLRLDSRGVAVRAQVESRILISPSRPDRLRYQVSGCEAYYSPLNNV
jgi:hypothetical protein